MSAGSDTGKGPAVVTPLMVAASRGDYASALGLLAASEVNARDRMGNTALIYAASGGHAEIVRLLLTSGADAAARNDAGASALERAALADRRDAAEILRAASRGERPEDALTEFDARLLDACGRAASEEVAELLSRGASAGARARGSGWTPLINACACGDAESARLLLDAGADPSAAAADGRTPLHFSAQLGDVDLIRMLLSRGADPERRDHYGETPLEAAERDGATEAARALAARDATT